MTPPNSRFREKVDIIHTLGPFGPTSGKYVWQLSAVIISYQIRLSPPGWEVRDAAQPRSSRRKFGLTHTDGFYTLNLSSLLQSEIVIHRATWGTKDSARWVERNIVLNQKWRRLGIPFTWNMTRFGNWSERFCEWRRETNDSKESVYLASNGWWPESISCSEVQEKQWENGSSVSWRDLLTVTTERQEGRHCCFMDSCFRLSTAFILLMKQFVCMEVGVKCHRHQWSDWG